MALFKEILTENGVLVKYHRIDTITHENGITKVSVLAYANDEYRIKEKANKEKQKRHNELLQMIFKENEKEQPDYEKVTSWTLEANSIVGETKAIDYSVFRIDFEYENITDLSLSNIYSMLKENKLFDGADNV